MTPRTLASVSGRCSAPPSRFCASWVLVNDGVTHGDRGGAQEMPVVVPVEGPPKLPLRRRERRYLLITAEPGRGSALRSAWRIASARLIIPHKVV